MLDAPRLTASTWLADVEYLHEAPSTQDRARMCAADPTVRLPKLIVADRQTAGRGREGNSWWTGAGSLAFSLLFDPAQFGCVRRPAPRLSLAAGVAVIDALGPRMAGRPLGLHWPNDVYVGARKLAGILVEVLPDGRHILGVGLNTNSRIASAPAALQATVATVLDLTGRETDHTEYLIDFLAALEFRLRQLESDAAALGTALDDLCLQHGEPLTVFLGDEQVTGRCAGIAPDGALVLDTFDGRRLFYSGTLRPPGGDRRGFT
jgi:BirA family biotin operon repressor/biotin-[acetyl-CoA-carboxylase] ligase